VTNIRINAKTRYIKVDDMVTLHVQQWPGSGEVACVLLHGVAEGSYVWEDLAKKLHPHCQPIGVDLRGHGNSDADPSRAYTLSQHVRDIRHVVDQLNLDEVIFIGHSLGGSVAACLAPGFGARLKGLVLVDSGPRDGNDTSKFLRDRLIESHRSYTSVREYANWLVENRPFSDPRVLLRWAEDALSLQQDGKFILKYDRVVLDYFVNDDDCSWWLPSIRNASAPILVVRGMASAVLSARTAASMIQAAVRGQLAVVPQAGHSIMGDNPEGFARVVLTFFREKLAL
jgi:pimeloyl-ACP methyl ester carboxylesterase